MSNSEYKPKRRKGQQENKKSVERMVPTRSDVRASHAHALSPHSSLSLSAKHQITYDEVHPSVTLNREADELLDER